METKAEPTTCVTFPSAPAVEKGFNCHLLRQIWPRQENYNGRVNSVSIAAFSWSPFLHHSMISRKTKLANFKRNFFPYKNTVGASSSYNQRIKMCPLNSLFDCWNISTLKALKASHSTSAIYKHLRLVVRSYLRAARKRTEGFSSVYTQVQQLYIW